jgi:hypothetical protein
MASACGATTTETEAAQPSRNASGSYHTTMRYMHLTQSAADEAIRLLDYPFGQPGPASGSGMSWQQRGNSGRSSEKAE